MVLGSAAGLVWGAASAGILAGLVTALLTPLCARVARSLRVLDPPGPRKTQAFPIPRLGGAAIFGGLLVGALIGLAVYPSHDGVPTMVPGLAMFGLATVLVFLVGLADDLFDFSFQTKFAVQFVAALMVVTSGWTFQELRVPLLGEIELGWFGPVLSVLWIVAVTNAINLIDGLDGLAGGVVAIIGASFLVLAVVSNDPLLVILMAAVTGACVGFLPHNWEPATIFMGDAGALTLGFVLAAMSTQASLKTPAAVAIFVPLLALGLPVMDTLLVMVVRVLQNPKSSFPDRVAGMFKADRRHLHHLLLRLYPSRRVIVMWLYGITLLFCMCALVVTWLDSASWGVALIVVSFVALVGIRSLGLRAETQALASEKRRETREQLLSAIEAEGDDEGVEIAQETIVPEMAPRERALSLAFSAANDGGRPTNGHNGHDPPPTVSFGIEQAPRVAQPLESRSTAQCHFTIDVEDWFHILDVDSSPNPATWGALPSTVERNFRHLLDMVEEYDVRATCFFLGWIAERFPHLAREASARGHEIASHGYSHELVYQMGPEEFFEDARASRLLLEDITGRPVRGYRAAGFSVTDRTPWFLDKLSAAGYAYSSSVFPAARGHGGLPGAPHAPYRVECEAGAMIELPISVRHVLGKPICFFGGGFLRLFPWPVIQKMTESVLAEGRPVIFYIHPREIDPDHPRLGMNPLRRFKTYFNLHSTEGKLRKILGTFRFTPLEESLSTLEDKRALEVRSA